MVVSAGENSHKEGDVRAWWPNFVLQMWDQYPIHRLPAKLGSQEFAPRLQRAPSAGFRAETRLMHRNCASFSRRSGIGAQTKSPRTPNVVARS